MYKLVLDSDGLIKLIKAKVPFEAIHNFKLTIPNEVFDEVVTEGKKGMHEDAFTAEDLAKKGLVTVYRCKKTQSKSFDEGLGKGELAARQALAELKASAILTDDKQFIEALIRDNVPFLMPADFIISLAGAKEITGGKARGLLANLKPFIDDVQYDRSKKGLEEMEDGD